MEIAGSIYKGVVEPSYKKPIRIHAIRVGHCRHKSVDDALLWTRPEKGDSAGKRRKIHVDSLTRKSKTVSSKALDILQNNVRSWETLELITLLVGILRTVGAAPYPGKFKQAARKQCHC